MGSLDLLELLLEDFFFARVAVWMVESRFGKRLANRRRAGRADSGAITKLLELLLDLVEIGVRPQLESGVVVFPGVHHDERAGGTR